MTLLPTSSSLCAMRGIGELWLGITQGQFRPWCSSLRPLRKMGHPNRSQFPSCLVQSSGKKQWLLDQTLVKQSCCILNQLHRSYMMPLLLWNDSIYKEFLVCHWLAHIYWLAPYTSENKQKQISLFVSSSPWSCQALFRSGAWQTYKNRKIYLIKHFPH